MALPANSISIPTFIPRLGIIIAISQTEQALITCLNPITFIVGQSVRIVIPPAMRSTMTAAAYDYGMPEINGMLGNIIQTFQGFPNSFLTDIDTRFFQAFTLPASATQPAQAVPVGELNSHLNGAMRNSLGPPSPFGGENVGDN